MGFPEADVAEALRMTSNTEAALALLLGETPAVERSRGELERGYRGFSDKQQEWLETWEMMLGTPEDTKRVLTEGVELEVLAELQEPFGTVFHQLVEHEEPEHLEMFCKMDDCLESMQDYTGFEDLMQEHPSTINTLLERMKRVSISWGNKNPNTSEKKARWTTYARCLALVINYQLRLPADFHLSELTEEQVAIVRFAKQFQFVQREKKRTEQTLRQVEDELEETKNDYLELQDENDRLIRMLHKAGIDYENSQ
jgi:hypothetical protein